MRTQCRVAVHGERRPAGGSALGGYRNPKQHGQLHRGRHGGRPRSRDRTGPTSRRPPCRDAAPPTPTPTPTPPPTTPTADRHRAPPTPPPGTTRRSRSQRNRHTTQSDPSARYTSLGPDPVTGGNFYAALPDVREPAAQFSLVCRHGTGRPSSVGAERRTARRDPARAPDRKVQRDVLSSALARKIGLRRGRALPTRASPPAPEAATGVSRGGPSRKRSEAQERLLGRARQRPHRLHPAREPIADPHPARGNGPLKSVNY